MRRLPSSYNEDNISDSEIDEVFTGTLEPSLEIVLEPRNHGERVLYVRFTSARSVLVEVGIEAQGEQLVVFHARKATKESIQAYEERF